MIAALRTPRRMRRRRSRRIRSPSSTTGPSRPRCNTSSSAAHAAMPPSISHAAAPRQLGLVLSEQPHETTPTRRREHNRSRSALNGDFADRAHEAAALRDHELDEVTNLDVRGRGRDLLFGDLVHLAVVHPGGAAADRAAAMVRLMRRDRDDSEPSAAPVHESARVLERREPAWRVLVANEDQLDRGRGRAGRRGCVGRSHSRSDRGRLVACLITDQLRLDARGHARTIPRAERRPLSGAKCPPGPPAGVPMPPCHRLIPGRSAAHGRPARAIWREPGAWVPS